jgi:hypothetical protein
MLVVSPRMRITEADDRVRRLAMTRTDTESTGRGCRTP